MMSLLTADWIYGTAVFFCVYLLVFVGVLVSARTGVCTLLALFRQYLDSGYGGRGSGQGCECGARRKIVILIILCAVLTSVWLVYMMIRNLKHLLAIHIELLACDISVTVFYEKSRIRHTQPCPCRSCHTPLEAI